MEYQLYQIILFFAIYAIAGFFVNTMYRALVGEKPTNKRICKGPYCPAYGFGTLAMMLTMGFLQNNPLVAFVVGAVIGTIVEVATILLVQLCSGCPSDRFTWYHPLLWGVGGTILMTHLHWLIELATNRVSPWIHFGFLVIFLITFISDYVDSVAELLEEGKENHQVEDN